MLNSIIQPLVEFTISLINKLGYTGVFLGMAIGSACIPLPSEIIMPFSGFLVSIGIYSFWPTVFIGAYGTLVGSILAYLVGAYGGKTLVKKLIKKYGKYFLIFEYELDEAEEWFRKYGELIASVSRVIPVIRAFISLPAGIAKMDFKKFCLYTFIGALFQTTILTYIGKVLGDNWRSIEKYFHQFDLIIVLLGVITIIWYIQHKLKKHKKRSLTL